MPYIDKEKAKKNSQKYYEINKIKINTQVKERMEKIKEDPEKFTEWKTKRKESVDNYYQSNKETINGKRKDNRKKIGLAKYKLSIEDYDKMFENQNKVCAICKEECNANVPSSYKLVVDHCHHTGTVRGLLCHSCNKLLGMAKDNIFVLKSAINYLKK